MRIAFYAPMKPPDDPTPSGDRTMGRALMAALRAGGHTVEIASRLRVHLRAPDPGRQTALADQAAAEAEALIRAFAPAAKPDLWFTYHNYHKAPDLLGPSVAPRLGIPYVIAEASHAPRRSAAWTTWFAAAEQAIRAADLHICLTARDRQGLAPVLGDSGRILDLPPFLDTRGLPPLPTPRIGSPARLVTVAMMRPGDKHDSYRFLAAALATIPDLDWSLDLVGDGPSRREVEDAFACLPRARLTWHGARAQAEVFACLAAGQILVWPGFGEAFGLGYLEAQAMGLPVVALDVAGVSSVVEHGRTGLLVSDVAPGAFGAAVADLIRDDALRIRLGQQAATFVRGSRTLANAARVLTDTFGELVTP